MKETKTCVAKTAKKNFEKTTISDALIKAKQVKAIKKNRNDARSKIKDSVADRMTDQNLQIV